MRKRSFQIVLLGILLTGLGTLACDVSTLTSLGLGGASKPQVTLSWWIVTSSGSVASPAAGSQIPEGVDVVVQSTATDKAGIVRVELSVDGAVVRTDAPPITQGQTSFSVIQKWKATAGNHTLSVRAFNASGAASDPVLASITVAPGSSAALPSPIAETPVAPLGAPTLSLTPTLSPVEPTVGATATKRPPTKTPLPPTPSAPPGVWGVSVRVDPSPPKRGQQLTFFVTFLNTTGAVQHRKWYVKIFPPDSKNSKGETPKVDNDLPVGTSEFQSGQWSLTGPGPCEEFLARVFWIDQSNNNVVEFIKPDQSGGPAAGLNICP